MDQELKPFCRWVESPIWVPPKGQSEELAETMMRQTGVLTSRANKWDAVVKEHRDSFSQVREIELSKASIRLPKGKLFVTVTEQKDFDRITDTVPACVQTRLEEFLEGPGKRHGVKVYYLKPLCVEVDDELLFTSREDVQRAIDKIQREVFSDYNRMFLARRSKECLIGAINGAVAVPRAITNYVIERRQRAIDSYQARLEFRRRQVAMDALKRYEQLKTSECTFDDMLNLTMPLERSAVVRRYSAEQELSRAKQRQLLMIAAGQLPWFAALTSGVSVAYMASVAILFAPPFAVCDPAFVAEMPGSDGVLLNIGHFDDIAGVRHVEM